MAGENAVIGAIGYPAQYFKITRIEYGTSPVYVTTQAAQTREVYFYNNTLDDFVITLEFSSYDDYQNAATWFTNYQWQVGNPNNTTLSQMVVWCPVRNFAKYGYPKTGVSFGDQVGELTYTMTLGFIGTLDPTQPSEQASYQAAGSDPTAQYFYPLGNQVSGASAADSSIFDAVTSAITKIPTGTSTSKTQTG